MSALPQQPPIECPECGGWLHLRASRHGLFYGCENFPGCRATHGAHPDGKPLGRPAGPRTKAARIVAHAALDPLWQDAVHLYPQPPETSKERKKFVHNVRHRARQRLYAWLAERLGVAPEEAHISMMDEATCERVCEIAAGASAAEIREWAKARNL